MTENERGAHILVVGDTELKAVEEKLRETNARLEVELAARQQAETELRERDREFRVALDAAPMAFAIYNAQRRLCFINQRGARIAGLKPEEMLGHTDEELFPPEQAARYLPLLRRAYETRSPQSAELAITVQGRLYHVIASFVPILDEQGEVNQVLSIVQDITSRKTAEEALRESEMRLRIVAENTYDWEFWIGPDETFLYCSPSCLPLTGHAAEEFLAHPNLLREIIHPDDLAAYDDHECRVAVTQSDGELEFRIVRPDGDVRWVGHTCIAIFDAAGQPLGRRGSCRDITPRREAEAQRAAALKSLQDSEARYRLLIENQGEGIGVVDLDERFALANPAADAIFGVPRGSLVGRSLLEFLMPEERAAIREQTQRRRTGQASTYELEITQPSGDRRWVLVTATPSFGDPGEFVGTFGVFRDITDRKAAEAALEESEAKFRALAEMTASAILIVGADGGILYANPAAEVLSEYSLAELLGMSAWELIHPEDCVWVERLGEASLRGEQVSSQYRFRGVTHRGEIRWIDFTAVVIYYQGVQALLCTAHDVTGLVLAQEAEREQRLLAEALRDMAAALAGPLGFEAMLGRILEVVEHIAPSDASTILLIEEGVARVACHRGFEGRIAIDGLRAVRLPVDQVANLKQMVETGRPYAMPDTHGDPAWVDLPGTHWIRSQAGAPICVGGKTIGFLSLDSAQPGFYTQAHAERLQVFANQAGIALENARLLDETERRAAEFAELYAITRELSEEHDPVKLLASVAEHARVLLRTSSAHIYLYDTERNVLALAVATDRDAPVGMRLALGEGMAGRVAMTRQPLTVADYPHWPGQSPRIAGVAHKAILQVPLLYSGALIGVLGVAEQVAPNRPFTEADVRLLSLLAGQAAAEIHNTRLYRAVQDELAERQHVQDELRRSESLYRLLAENSTDVIWKLDLQTLRFTYISPAVTRLRGLTVAEAMAEPLDQTMDPQSLAYVRAGLAERLAAFAAGDKGAADAVTLVRQPRKDGTWIDVEIATTLLTDEQGQPTEVLGVSRDISARKQAEDEIHRSGEMLRAVLDTIPQRVFWKDRDSVYLGANRSFVQDAGLSDPVEIIGKTDAGLRWSEMAARFRDEDRHIAETNTPLLPFEEAVTQVDGSVRWQRTSKSPLHDAQGQVAGVLGVYEDITEQKQAQAKRQALLAELARSNEELERFAYVVSHDLQEPLRMVASFVQLLGERYRGQLDQDADDFIGFAVDGAQRMQQLISDLLEYSRVSTRGQPLQPTEATHAIRQAVRNLELAIEDAGATVTWDELPTVPADDTQLMQVFQNLIGNAIKFRGVEPPRVHVSARRLSALESGRVGAGESGRGGEWASGRVGAAVAHAPTRPFSSTWQFAVRDNGIGIAPEYHARIFDVFQRLHTREAYEGTGIGLAIVKKIVERHGGRIWVESQPGAGATFYFTLPAVDHVSQQ